MDSVILILLSLTCIKTWLNEISPFTIRTYIHILGSFEKRPVLCNMINDSLTYPKINELL
jgi:hypothetical protein